MSAPNAGRQSPSPSRQTGAQQQDAPSSGKATEAGKESGNQQASEETKTKGLESNPVAPLEEHAKQAVSKDGRGGT